MSTRFVDDEKLARITSGQAQTDVDRSVDDKNWPAYGIQMGVDQVCRQQKVDCRRPSLSTTKSLSTDVAAQIEPTC